MIKKFDEYVKESLWKKGFDRSESGEKRKEEYSELETILKLPIQKKRKAAEILLYNFWDYTTDEHYEYYDDYVNPQIWTELTTFLNINVENKDNYNDEDYDDWGVNDALDIYTLDEFLKKCYQFIDNMKSKWGDRFREDYFYGIIDML